MRPSSNRKEDYMLKKFIIASALALGFFTSFQVGNTRSGGSPGVTASVGIVTPALACTGVCCEIYYCDGKQ
jgi:hypothetical protein